MNGYEDDQQYKKQSASSVPGGAMSGATTGASIGMLGGPMGMAVGAGAGALAGAGLSLWDMMEQKRMSGPLGQAKAKQMLNQILFGQDTQDPVLDSMYARSRSPSSFTKNTLGMGLTGLGVAGDLQGGYKTAPSGIPGGGPNDLPIEGTVTETIEPSYQSGAELEAASLAPKMPVRNGAAWLRLGGFQNTPRRKSSKPKTSTSNNGFGRRDQMVPM